MNPQRRIVSALRRSRLTAAFLTVAASGLILGQATAAHADDHGRGGGPVLVVSPAPGKLTKAHSEVTTYSYDPKASSSSDSAGDSSSSGSSAGSAVAPQAPSGPLANATDTAKSVVSSAAGGASGTVGSL
ncbi:hypothetical protein [Streptomyces sp. I05A-00742]|uniref:hypothetical protein n=1 Tax=Streptomyces sp. I05A-00742 TaxID=2732853 RepID=UPI00289714B6|nr:hypothetical protein [Streptomyces sp. I05A-00742]